MTSVQTKLLWTIRQVAEAVNLSASTIRRRVADGTFPQPIKGSQGSPLLWNPAHVAAWAKKRERR